jgi:septal ring factor EnvC (AmiA/AmiB activator)
MSAELIGILSVGVALAALLLTSVNNLREEMRALREDMRRMENRLDALEQRMARLEGVLDGLREALFGRSREAAG